MKYKLINKQTSEETLCDKVTIDGFDYYVSDDEAQIGENVLWVKQTYHGAEEYANYICKVYTLRECFPRGKEIILKDFYPKKSLDEVRQSIKVFLEKAGKQRTSKQIEESAIKNQATSGNLYLKIGYNISENDIKKVIATNNPNIDIPKVVDEVEMLAHKHFAKERFNWEQENPNGIKSPQSLIEHYNRTFTPIFRAGYNKSQETHPFSEEDMIEFAEWVDNMGYRQVANGLYKSINDEKGKLTKELLQIWKEQQPKVIYYE